VIESRFGVPAGTHIATVADVVIAAKNMSGDSADNREKQAEQEADCVNHGIHRSRWLAVAD
jgi:hypothetical protein